MTNNQIDYLGILESNRHNTTTEAEDVRSHKANEKIAQGELDEKIKHNRKTEKQEDTKIKDLRKHNKLTRKENKRAHKAKEKEDRRSHKAQESIAREGNAIGWANNSLGYVNAAIGQQNANTNARMADISQQNANTNSRNADSQAVQAAASKQNADTNSKRAKWSNKVDRAQIKKYSAEVDKLVADTAYAKKQIEHLYEVIKNTKSDTEKKKAEKELIEWKKKTESYETQARRWTASEKMYNYFTAPLDKFWGLQKDIFGIFNDIGKLGVSASRSKGGKKRRK